MPEFNEEVSIPGISENLLFMILPRDLRDILTGDLYEEFYQEIIPKYGPQKARWWYRGQVLKSMRFYLLKRKGDIMFFIFSIIVFILISVLVAIMGGQLTFFINIPAILMVFIPPFIFAVAATSIKAWTLSLKLLLIDQDHPEEKEIKEVSRFLKVFGNMSLTLGFFYALIGATQMLNGFVIQGLATNDVLRASGVCVLTLLYGITVKCILYVADQRICNRYSI